MSDLSPEIGAYFARGRRKIAAVAANDDFSLTLWFDNGEKRRYDASKVLRGAAFAPLRDAAKFRAAFVGRRGGVAWDIDPAVDSETVWNNRLDLCPDSCYLNSQPLA